MSVPQLSVFVENKTGHLADALATLVDGNVNILSFTIADTSDYGILRLLVDNVEEAKRLLSSASYAVVQHSVVCAIMPDRPGVLASIARLVANSGLDIEYIYLGARDSLVLKTSELEGLEALLTERGYQVLGPDDLV